MNKTLIFLLTIISTVLFSCSSSKNNLTPERVVVNYIDGLNESNFSRIELCISDSLLTMEGGFVLSKSRTDYYIHFQWDSVFSPKYSIIDSKKISENSIEITLAKICERIKFLHDSSTIYKSRIDFHNNRIVKIDNFELVYFDTVKWTNRRDSLVTWINKNHPDLKGFIYDQTPGGACNYLKAIKLYKDNK